MSFSVIDKVLSTVKEFARPNLYEVYFYFHNYQVPVPESLQYAIKSIELSDTTVEALELKRSGESFNLAGNSSNNEVTLTIALDTEYKNKIFFDSWLESKIYDVYRGKYFDFKRIKGDNIIIFHLNKNFEPIRFYELHHVFPIKISSPTFSYDSDNEINTFQVTLKCAYFTTYLEESDSSYRGRI